MKLAFVFNYPLIDNVDWKKTAIQKSIDAGYNVDVYYGKTHLSQYVKAYLTKRKFGNTSTASNRLKEKKEKNYSFFVKLGIKPVKVKDINSQKAIDRIASKNYDYLIIAIDQILSKRFIEGINSKILNVHYATLPDIKGVNAIEWNYLVNGKCELTLHYIDAGIDTGGIIRKEEIPYDKEDSFYMMREKLQKKIPSTLLDFLQSSKENVFENKGGLLYTYMHKEIQEIITKTL